MTRVIFWFSFLVRCLLGQDEAQSTHKTGFSAREGIRLASMIAIERLSKTFETARGTSHLALSDISLDVAQGEFVSILGPSGCGKSTLLYIVGGFVHAERGHACASAASR